MKTLAPISKKRAQLKLIVLFIAFLFDSLIYHSVFAQTPHKPNILFILLDDARYDSFEPNGGPSFFQTPAINRIAHEGVNFKLTGATSALCVPSRSSIYTGLYPHHHGALDSGTSPREGLTYVSSILQENGYYTGFIGKWLLNNKLPDLPVGFDYWAITDSFAHLNPTVIFKDGTVIHYQSHDAKVFTDLAMDFLQHKVPGGKPWALFLFHRVPHDPLDPFEEEDTLYQHSAISFPDNFDSYKKFYPSFLYPGHQWRGDSLEVDEAIRDYYETCHAAEYSVDSILSYLESNHLLDSTLIIFSSDNGYLYGEHDLEKKSLAYEESFRIPLFMRYPRWFNAGTVIENEWAANIDFAPTLLEAAGIANTYNMDGISLHQLALGNVHRKDFFYELYESRQNSGHPREAVRSLRYKYIYSYCNDTTEEFFDLQNDLEENENLIFNAGYASLIQQFRYKRDNLRIITGDTMHPNLRTCNLVLPVFYLDEDHDGYGDPNTGVEAIAAPSGYISEGGDCNDANANQHPNATELCNGIDDNCNGRLDDIIEATIIPPGTLTLCQATYLTLGANTGTGVSYQWMKNGILISGETESTYITQTIGDYQVIEAIGNCADTSAITKYKKIVPPDAIITPLGLLDICSSGSVMLQANTGSGYTYQWSKGSGNISGATNQNYTAKKVATYKVTVINLSNCSKISTGIKVINSCREDFNEDESSIALSLFPNPSNGKFNIELMVDADDGTQALVRVTNMIGQIVYEEVTTTMNGLLHSDVQLENAESGMYSVKVTISEEVITTHVEITGDHP